MAMAMATRFLLGRLRRPLSHIRNLNSPTTPITAASSFIRRDHSSASDESLSRSSPNDDVWSKDSKLVGQTFGSAEEADNRKWSIYEREVLKDIKGTVELANEILHSGRYNCGDKLSPDDEKEVVEKLLAYHPHGDDKIGCGLDSIMMDKHPVYGRSRCFFVVRVDCSMDDFSYRKCLASYVRQKYPYEAEGLIWKLRQFFWREDDDVCFLKMIRGL